MLIRIISPYSSGRTKNAISKTTKVLACLQVFSHGSYQQVAADSVWTFTSQASISRCVDEVTQTILAIKQNYLAFPQSKETRKLTSEKFVSITSVIF